MLYFVSGNFWDQPADIRVNTVNCVGVSGKGVALQFKKAHPEMYQAYRAACERGEVQPGRLHIFDVSDSYKIVNFPTKRHWRDNSRYDDIDLGLKALQELLRALGKVTVTLPALGCGHGGLDWNRIRRRITVFLGDLEAEIYVYSPEDSRRV